MKTYGCVGYPLSHSFSKKYFEAKFEKEGIDNARFENYEIQDINDLSNIIDSNSSLLGFSVTIPHKVAVVPLLDELDESAKAVGAVNSVKVSNSKLYGHNTDVHGFSESIKPYLMPHHASGLILGTGGAAKAVEYVLKELGIAYHFVSLNPTEGQMNYSAIDEEVLSNHSMIINCTPLGMYPDVESYSDIPYEYLTDKHLLFDLTYNPAETAFLRKGGEQGATIVNGQAMLELQAEKSWEIWNS